MTSTIDLSHHGVDQEDWHDIVRSMEPFVAGRHARLVVLAPHPDDETLGVGGLIAETSKRGAPVLVVSLTDGEAAGPIPHLADLRHSELLRAVDRLGIAAPVAVDRWKLPDGRLAEHRDEIAARLAALVRPGDLVVGPLDSDGHPDHEAAGHAVLALAGKTAFATDVEIALYPVWAWHWHGPSTSAISRKGRRVELSEFAWQAKLDAVRMYESQTAGDAPVLPDHFVRRFEQPFEVLVCA